jgi:hypothetical protein
MRQLIVLLLFSTLALRAEVEFSGFFITSDTALYSLTDMPTGASSGWLKVGQTFRGHTIVSFDKDTDTLNVRQGDHVTRLRLRASKVTDGRSIINGTISLQGGERLQGVWATLFLGEESNFPLKDGLTLFLMPQRGDDGNVVYRARFVARGKDGKEETLSAPAVIAKHGQPFAIQVGELGYAFTP